MTDPTSGRSDMDAEHGAKPDPAAGSLSEGVSASLSELERKLRLLEDELASVSPRPDSPTGMPWATSSLTSAPAWEAGGGGETENPGDDEGPRSGPDTPNRRGLGNSPHSPSGRSGETAPRHHEPQGLAVPREDLELLLRFRDQLERYSRALVTDYGRLLSHLGIEVPPVAPASVPADASASSPAAGPAQPPEAKGTAETLPDSTEEGPNEYGGRGVVYEEILLEGSVTLEAGPVRGVATLGAIEAELERVAGVHARVRAFEGGRAVFELRLEDSTRLVQELRAALSRDFFVLDASPGRLSLVFSEPST